MNRIAIALPALVLVIAGWGCETVKKDNQALFPDEELHSYVDSELEKYESLSDEYPKRADFHYKIASIHFQKDDYRKSAASLETAIYLDPSQARYHYQLGRVCMKMPDLEQAEAHFRKAVAAARE